MTASDDNTAASIPGVIRDPITAANLLRVNADGSINVTGAGAGTVTSITQGTGMSFSVTPITSTGTINLANTAVSTGSYTNASLTVDQQGRITAASSGLTPVPYGNIAGPPSSASFSWVNQGSAAVAQAGGTGTPIMLTMPNDTSENVRGRFVAQPSTPYTLYALMQYDAATSQANNNAQNFGIFFYDGTKLMGIEIVITSVSGLLAGYLRVQKITNVTTDGSTLAARPSTTLSASKWPLFGLFSPVFFKLANSGTTLTFSWSLDGYNFVDLASEAVGTYITPTQIGFAGLNLNAVNTIDLHINLLSWKTA